MTATDPTLLVDVLIEAPAWRKAVKGPVGLCERAVRAAVTTGLAEGAPLAGAMGVATAVDVCVALEDDESVRALNRDFRGVDRPTNVLAFAALEAADGSALAVPPASPDDPDAGEPLALGDVIVALETTRDEARRDGKALEDHLVHLVVHGVLHLLGHDHQADAEAERMEALETRVLAGLGIADPHAPPGLPASGVDRLGTGDHDRLFVE